MNMQQQVLVVDDEEGVRTMCARALSEKGFRVRTAANGEEALRDLKEIRADLVLTDIRMPEEADGLRLAEEVKHRYPAVDVILMTGHPSVETAVPALRSRAADYLVKPFGPAQLAERVENHFQEQGVVDELESDKRVREELDAAYQELQGVERMKESILSRLGHELRTPLTAIQLAMKVMAGESDQIRRERAGQIMQSNVAWLGNAVEDLLAYAEVRKESFEIYREPVDVGALWQEIVAHYRPLLEKRGLSVDMTFPPEQVLAWGSRPLLRKALGHLFLNAVQFNRTGGSIRLDLCSDGKRVETSVSDTGIAIPADKLHRIFDSFYQVAEYLTREGNGMGLGLAIVRRVVETHGGHVTVESREGQGSRFRVVLPTRAADVERFLNGLDGTEGAAS